MGSLIPASNRTTEPDQVTFEIRRPERWAGLFLSAQPEQITSEIGQSRRSHSVNSRPRRIPGWDRSRIGWAIVTLVRFLARLGPTYYLARRIRVSVTDRVVLLCQAEIREEELIACRIRGVYPAPATASHSHVYCLTPCQRLRLQSFQRCFAELQAIVFRRTSQYKICHSTHPLSSPQEAPESGSRLLLGEA